MSKVENQNKISQRKKRYRLLYALEATLEIPMFLLSLIWLWFFVAEFTVGLTPAQQTAGTVIWIIFIIEFLLKWILAPSSWVYLKHNWLIGMAIFLPALRMFRLLRALRLLRSVRVFNTFKFIRALSNTRRVARTLHEVQGKGPAAEMDVGIMLAHSLLADKEKLQNFISEVLTPVKHEMENATGIGWNFHLAEATVLDSDKPRRPTDFIEEASLRMAQGPFDMLLVVTDVALMSRRKTLEFGLPSPVSRIMVLSTRKLVSASKEEPARDLLSGPVISNAVTLLLHLLGHVCGLQHVTEEKAGIMTSFRFIKDKAAGIKVFSAEEKRFLQERAENLPDRELHGGNLLAALAFHLFMALRHPVQLLYPLLASRALLLPLSLPGLTTAAFAPALLLVFTAEIWDVGIGMSNTVAGWYAVISILVATYYLITVQSLFLPRQEKRILTEHLAITNSVIFLSLLLTVIGLFLMLMAFMLVIVLFIFPEGLMSTWPTLEHGGITTIDKIRLAAFISTVGISTGALAGGLEGRSVMRHLALFTDRA